MSDSAAIAFAPFLGPPVVAKEEEPKPLPVTPTPVPADASTTSNLEQAHLADDAAAPAVAPPAVQEQATTLPVGHGVHPVHQAEALDNAPDHLVDANVEKQKGAERELKGHAEQGTVVPGIEDDKLWSMRRRFDNVSRHQLHLGERDEVDLGVDSKSYTSFPLPPSYLPESLICVLLLYRLSHLTRICSREIWSESTRPPEFGESTRGVR